MAKMGKPIKFTDEKIIEALKKERGLVFLAARRLKCTPETIYAHARSNPAVKQAIDDAREEIIDVGEGRLFDAVKDREPWAVSLLLKTLGRNRGYVERQETRVGGDSTAPPIETKNQLITLDELDTLPLELKKQLLEAVKAAKEKKNGEKPQQNG